MKPSGKRHWLHLEWTSEDEVEAEQRLPLVSKVNLSAQNRGPETPDRRLDASIYDSLAVLACLWPPVGVCKDVETSCPLLIPDRCVVIGAPLRDIPR